MQTVAGPVKTIHPQVIKRVGITAALELLSIAADLRSGKIKPENLKMRSLYWNDDLHRDSVESAKFPSYAVDEYYSECGTSCCILGHLRIRLDEPQILEGWNRSYGLDALFRGSNPSDPRLAADAIENYVYNYSSNPWNDPLLDP